MPADNRGVSRFAAAGICLVVCFSGCRAPNPDQKDSEPGSPKVDLSDLSPSPATVNPEKTSQPKIRFEEVGPDSGFAFARFDDISPRHRIIETNGGGVAVIDLDGDGFEDLFLTNGRKLPLAEFDSEHVDAVFRNVRGKNFREVSRSCGLVLPGFSTGCAVGDWDSDGFDDLFVCAFGQNSFWQNNGDGTFEEKTDEFGVTGDAWSTSAAFADLNRDGHLDLYVVNYLDESDTDPTLCRNDASPDGYIGCSPAIMEGVPDQVIISCGAWKCDPTAVLRPAGSNGKGLGVVVCDLNNDLWPEVYVANDGQANFLFSVSEESSEHFAMQERAMASSVALSESGFAQASMGVIAADFDQNGYDDLFMTHFFGDTNTLYSNYGDLLFEDTTRRSRLGTVSRAFLGFGAAAIDVDNDGWQDLMVANGHVDNREWMPGGQPWKMTQQLFRNTGEAVFEDISHDSGEYFRRRLIGRGLATVDLDHDGLRDVVVSHQVDNSAILLNRTITERPAISLLLIGRHSNRCAVNARAWMQNSESNIHRSVTGGGSFQSASSRRVCFGPGNRDRAKIKVDWPLGEVSNGIDMAPGMWALVEGRSHAVRLP